MQSLQDIHDLLKPLEDEDHPGRHTVAANPSPPSLRRGNTHAAFERTPSPHAAPRRLSRSNTAQGIADEAATTAKRRRNMYWKATATGDDARLLGDDGAVREVPAATFSLISGALTDMFFLGSTMFSQMHAVVAAFELETFEEGDVLLREGDRGDKLYVLEAGVVRVSRSRVFHEQQRSRPSTPTGRGAFSFEDTDDFDDDPDSPEIYLLAKAMKNRKYHPGAELFAPGREVDTCFLVEDGELVVSRGGGGGAAATIDELFPDGVDTQDVSVDGDVVLCRPGTLLGVRARARAKGDDCDAVVAATTARASGLPRHAFAVATFEEHLGAARRAQEPVAAVAEPRRRSGAAGRGPAGDARAAVHARRLRPRRGPDLWSVLYDPDEAGFEDHSPLCDASDALLRHYCACVAECLFHLHARGIVYRDLKPENLMVARNGYLKLVDFGFAKRLPYYRTDADEAELTAHFKTYTMCGTAEYISPEIINGSGHDWSADVWAAGCLFHELLVGSTPFVEFPGETTDQALIFKRAWPRVDAAARAGFWTLRARPAEPYDDAKDPGAFAVFH
ncbi:cGMP-dependent protein kinase [Aureococcus anophagefferens]|nr:cGMP-dependent protein kinase [Aureococcus anophagefferens]